MTLKKELSEIYSLSGIQSYILDYYDAQDVTDHDRVIKELEYIVECELSNNYRGLIDDPEIEAVGVALISLTPFCSYIWLLEDNVINFYNEYKDEIERLKNDYNDYHYNYNFGDTQLNTVLAAYEIEAAELLRML